MSKRILKQYCTKNFRKIRHRKGFGVHSPFAYNLITKVIEETYSYYAYQQIEEVWHTRVCNQLTQDDFQRRKPVSEKYGRLLFRMVNRFRPDIIFEYGSCCLNFFAQIQILVFIISRKMSYLLTCKISVFSTLIFQKGC